MTPGPATYRRHRFPAEVISRAVRLCRLFGPGLRDVELIPAGRGVAVTHESVRRWCLQFGRGSADGLRRRRPKPGDIWHPDEVSLRIDGVLHHLWRAVDRRGAVPDILVQGRRNGAAAKRSFKWLLAGPRFKPRRLVTGGLRSRGVARRDLLPRPRCRTRRARLPTSAR